MNEQGIIKLRIPANNAKPGQALTPQLAQKGINSRDFCIRFNELTKNLRVRRNTVIPTKVLVTNANVYEIILQAPALIEIINALLVSIEHEGKVKNACFPRQVVYELAVFVKIFRKDTPIQSLCKELAGKLWNMGYTMI